jgi:hypothetical protein
MMQRMMMMLLRTEIITEVLQVLRICLLDCESKGIECESPIKGWNRDCREQRSTHHIPAKVSGKEEEDSFRINREKTTFHLGESIATIANCYGHDVVEASFVMRSAKSSPTTVAADLSLLKDKTREPSLKTNYFEVQSLQYWRCGGMVTLRNNGNGRNLKD